MTLKIDPSGSRDREEGVSVFFSAPAFSADATSRNRRRKENSRLLRRFGSRGGKVRDPDWRDKIDGSDLIGSSQVEARAICAAHLGWYVA